MADLTQTDVNRLAGIRFAKSADINTHFKRSGSAGFAAWFNAKLGGQPPFVRPSGDPLKMPTKPESLARFDSFWDGLQNAFDRSPITSLDFAALMCIVLNETGGEFFANPEKVGSDGHPGLAYAFDRIEGKKASYNTLSGNRTAGSLFNDAAYIDAHEKLGGAAEHAGHGDDHGGAWHSERYPQESVDTEPNHARNGFIMQADFYKFRGRGVIQTTGRAAYEPCAGFIQSYAGADPTLTRFKQDWSTLSAAAAATTSSNANWDAIFGTGDMLARAVAIHAGTGADDYREMSTEVALLTDLPVRTGDKVPRGKRGSIYFMGRRISGSFKYASGPYRDRVTALLTTMLSLP